MNSTHGRTDVRRRRDANPGRACGEGQRFFNRRERVEIRSFLGHMTATK